MIILECLPAGKVYSHADIHCSSILIVSNKHEQIYFQNSTQITLLEMLGDKYGTKNSDIVDFSFVSF